MIERAREVLAGITTVIEMVAAFQDEERCRTLLEEMVGGATGRIRPSALQRSIALAGRDLVGERAPASINAPIESVGFSSP